MGAALWGTGKVVDQDPRVIGINALQVVDVSSCPAVVHATDRACSRKFNANRHGHKLPALPFHAMVALFSV